MCGILGVLSYNEMDLLSHHLDALHHRGPDGSGSWLNQQQTIYLGHTRLAILEPTPAGKQPMTDRSLRYTITFNGEIYNHLDLRSLLPINNWRGTSDTETLLELLADRGTEALPLLKGMFAFALHDALDDSVLLVRDRLGIKPLWYRISDGTCSFASEVRPLLRTHEVAFTKQALNDYIGFGRLPDGLPVIDEIQAVRPGTWIKLMNNGLVEKRNWWPIKISTPAKQKNRTGYSQKVKALVTDAIEEHLLSDVGVGAFLSGGIDSSIIAAVAGKRLGKQLQTFTVGFPQATFDERAIARQTAKQAGSDHHEIEVSEEICLRWVEEAVTKLDLPSVDAINTFIVAKAVRETGLKVALSGLGADELFGGYPSFTNVPRLALLNRIPAGLRQLAISKLPKVLINKLAGLSDFSASSLTLAYRRFTSATALEAMGFGAAMPAIPLYPAKLDTMGAISWAEIQGYMIPMLLRDSDQMSMAVGLETRVPFLDHILVEEVLAIPQQYKKGPGLKPLLVDAFRADLLPIVYNRPKQGFALPMPIWMQGPLAEFTQKGILAAGELLKVTEPRQQWEHFKKGQLHWTRVWHWCVLGHWLNQQQNAYYSPIQAN